MKARNKGKVMEWIRNEKERVGKENKLKGTRKERLKIKKIN